MLNRTVTRLSVQSLVSSPFISLSHSQFCTLFQGIRSTNMLGTFLYSSYIPHSLIVEKSYFSHSLARSIHINSIIFTDQTFFTRISMEEQPPILIVSSLFYHITHLGSNGGALQINVKDSSKNSVVLNDNGFISCSTDHDGGAGVITAPKVSLNGNCFDSCKSGQSSMSIQLSMAIKDAVTFINNTNVHKCAPTILSGSQYSFCANFGMLSINQFNSSRNCIAGLYGFMGIVTEDELHMKYALAYQCNSNILLLFIGSPECTFYISDLMFINNTNRGETIIDNTMGTFEYYNCIFLDNIQYKSNDIIISIQFYGNLTVSNCFSDKNLSGRISYNAKYFFINNQVVNENYPTFSLSYIDSAKCWKNYVMESPKLYEIIALKWGTTIYRSALVVGICLAAIIGKRIYHYGDGIRAQRLEFSEIEALSHTTNQFSYEYDFEVL